MRKRYVSKNKRRYDIKITKPNIGKKGGHIELCENGRDLAREAVAGALLVPTVGCHWWEVAIEKQQGESQNNREGLGDLT